MKLKFCQTARLEVFYRLVSFLAKVKIFIFWLKTMDYSQAFLPKLSSFFEAFLLPAGRCYEAKICAILLLLRYPFVWYPFWPKSKISNSGQKPWTITHGLILEVQKKF